MTPPVFLCHDVPEKPCSAPLRAMMGLEVTRMECMALGAAAQELLDWQYHLEDLGEAWRVTPVRSAAQAMQLMQARYVQTAVLLPCRETAELLALLARWTPIAPPWLLGVGVEAPDGSVATAQALHKLLQRRRQACCLPALCLGSLPRATCLARSLLNALDSPRRLRASAFLPDMAALTVVHPPLLVDLQHHLYPLTARRHGMTPCAVERSLRLLVEATWSRGSLAALERFFGSSVDPERGKPTNREFLCRVQERITMAAGRVEGAHIDVKY